MHEQLTRNTFKIPGAKSEFIIQMLNWSKQFNIFVFMDSCGYHDEFSRYDAILACGAHQLFASPEAASAFQKKNGGWLFGHINFEYGYREFSLSPKVTEKPCFPVSNFFVPKYLITIKDDELTITCDAGEGNKVFREISMASSLIEATHSGICFQPSESKSSYLQKVESLLNQIRLGNCYEINYCQHFYAEDAEIDPHAVYTQLAAVSPNPFAALYRLNEDYLMCASPERFIRRQSNRLISQPIKGTTKRDLENAENDFRLKHHLATSEKDRCENVMIVDLVRNDMSKIAAAGSVQVPQLFTIDSFPQVHQMKSTIECLLPGNITFNDLITAMFPMGSMTGAPKKKVLELTSAYEVHPRGIYSGTIGYIDPEGNCDFNVVIRSVIYSRHARFLEYYVGGGITINSNPSEEYDECLLKAKAIQRVFS